MRGAGEPRDGLRSAGLAVLGAAAVAGLTVGAFWGANMLSVAAASRQEAKPPVEESDLSFDQHGRLLNWPHVLAKAQQGGVSPGIRRTVWPYLLGVYDPQQSTAERAAEHARLHALYAKLLAVCAEMDSQVREVRTRAAGAGAGCGASGIRPVQAAGSGFENGGARVEEVGASRGAADGNADAGEMASFPSQPAASSPAHPLLPSAPPRAVPSEAEPPPSPPAVGGSLAAFAEAHRIIVLDALRTDFGARGETSGAGRRRARRSSRSAPHISQAADLPDVLLVDHCSEGAGLSDEEGGGLSPVNREPSEEAEAGASGGIEVPPLPALLWHSALAAETLGGSPDEAWERRAARGGGADGGARLCRAAPRERGGGAGEGAPPAGASGVSGAPAAETSIGGRGEPPRAPGREIVQDADGDEAESPSSSSPPPLPPLQTPPPLLDPSPSALRLRRQQRLTCVLSAYSVHDPETGYCQGMADLAAVFVLLYERDDALAWACFERLMRAARRNFRHDESGIRRQLGDVARVLRDTDPPLFERLVALRASNCMFAYRMVVVMLRRELSLADTQTLWEMAWAAQEAACLGRRRLDAVAGVVGQSVGSGSASSSSASASFSSKVAASGAPASAAPQDAGATGGPEGSSLGAASQALRSLPGAAASPSAPPSVALGPSPSAHAPAEGAARAPSLRRAPSQPQPPMPPDLVAHFVAAVVRGQRGRILSECSDVDDVLRLFNGLHVEFWLALAQARKQYKAYSQGLAVLRRLG